MQRILHLPQLVATLPCAVPDEFPLMISGGRQPALDWLAGVRGEQEVWAIDRGIETCLSARMLPKVLMGDGDSASAEAWAWAEAHNVLVSRYPKAKDFTDTQLALKAACEAGHGFVLLTGCFGGRLDHLYSNIVSCAFAPLCTVLADEQEIVIFLHGGESLNLSFNTRPEALSLIPCTKECTGVACTGVHWPLANAVLQQATANATSNWVEAEEVTVSIEKGVLAVYLCFTP